jgi:CYTH domain-containing protein
VKREVERKFFFDPELWKLRSKKSVEIEQGYLDRTGEWEVRLRRAGSQHFYTMKTGQGLDRGEWEVPVTAEAFAQLWSQTLGRRLSKVREKFVAGAQIVEVDHYRDGLQGLVTAEVEFVDARTSASFLPPPAFGPELTYDPRFKNRNLSGVGTPPCQWGLGPETWSYGVLPFRETPRGPELVIVSTLRRDRWIFPKGQPEEGVAPREVAENEALEEAGVRGEICGHPVVLPYPRVQGVTNLLLFPMRVVRLDSQWLESGQRDRKLVPLSEAADYGDVVALGARVIREMVGVVGP